MLTSFTNRRALLPIMALMVGLAGCASHPAMEKPTGKKSKYAAEKTGAAAAASNAMHVPPVPHTPEEQKVAEKALPEFIRALKTMQQQDYKKALVMLQSLSSRFPNLSGPLVNEGICYLKLKQYGDAEDTLRQAIKVNGKNPYAHDTLGVVLRKEGKFDEARKEYEAALQLDPKYARAHFNLAVLAELYEKNNALALQHFEKYQALQKNPDKNVANWIIDLKRRVSESKPKDNQQQAAPAPQKQPGSQSTPASGDQKPAADNNKEAG